jgi:dihydrofolate synthase/folylpolyglutamate synthase
VPYMPNQVQAAEMQGRNGMAVSSLVQAGDGQKPVSTYELSVMDETITVASPLLGRHQLRNVALAIAAAVELNKFGFKITPQHIERGIRETRWPGRLQLIEKDGQQYLLDVAHNPAGAWALRSALSTYFEDRPLVFVFAALRDKAIAEMAEILFPLAEHVVATTVGNPRAATPEQVAEAGARTGAAVTCCPDPAEALRTAKDLAGCKALVVVTGSIYLVGEALQQLGQ